jgi:hypothetical protein
MLNINYNKTMKKNVNPVPKLRVDLGNLDDITSNTLRFFFTSNLCDYAVLSQTTEQANLIIIDYDRGYNKDFSQYLANNKKFAIVLHMASKEAENDDRMFWLVKPIQAILLKQNIQAIRECIIQQDPTKSPKVEDTVIEPAVDPTAKNTGIKNDEPRNENTHLHMAIHKESSAEKQNRYRAHKHVGSNKDIDPTNKEELNRIYLTPEKYLYHHLSRAISIAKDDADAEIKTLLGNIYYQSSSQKFFYTFETNKLKLMQGSPLFYDTTVTATTVDTELLVNKTGASAKRLIWESAILASKGRIPKGTNLKNEVNMYYWPNYSKIQLFRYVIQITAAWSRHKLSLIDTATQLDIPQRYVFTLYCAMHAINSATISNINPASLTLDNNKSQSIFTKILSHIFNKSV